MWLTKRSEVVSTVVSVLCARVRMEEKWLIESLAQAGVPARQLPPSASPLPVGPVPAEPLATQVVGGDAAEVSRVIIDRCADRIVAGAIVPDLLVEESASGLKRTIVLQLESADTALRLAAL